jgi:DNA-binding SARP family transcriptional activator/tetratricopeptide (TPR) repeat protein
MEFRILGPLEVRADGRTLTPARPKQRTLLALLLLRANEVVTRDELLDALWGERPPKTAGTALHGHVAALRRLVGAAAIETRPPGYLLRAEPEQVDVGRFEALVRQARTEKDAARKNELLRAALALFYGDPLVDFRYEPFAQEAAGRIEAMRLSALEDWIETELDLGRHEEVIPELEHLVSTNSLRERLRGQLMLALYRSGRQADALSAYREARHELAEQLGLEPGRQLQELERKILSHDASLAAPAHVPIEDEARPGRERKRVTLLLCELSGVGGDAEEVEAGLEPALAAVKREVERVGGRVESAFGGSVVAVFGAPNTHEDDPERAVEAGHAILSAVAPEFEPRIRVETTEAIVAGDSVVSAPFRLSAPAANTIVLDEATLRATIGPVDRPTTELVGRRRELEQLTAALTRARAERSSQLVTVVGVPGIGKTRLVRELYALVEAAPDDVLWLEGRSLPYGDGVTFWALGEIVKGQAGIFESDSAAAAEEKLRLAVEGASIEEKDAAWVFDHLRALVGLGEGQARAEGRGEAFAAWRLFFEALADETPLVLVLEDLHWADEGLLDFVDDLVGGAVDVPLLVVAISRPELFETRPGWGGGKRNATTLSLGPLSDDETGQLLAELLENEVDPELVKRVQGNPLYAEEYARLVLERGASDSSVPESLQALIAARLDALPAQEKALVQNAAVVGEVSWAGAIAAVGEWERPLVERLAGSIARKDFLKRRRRSSVEDEVEFAFGHVLIRDVAYGQIPRAERGRKHRLAAEWIESLGRREDHVELLAHHYLRAFELARTAGEETVELRDRARLAARDAAVRAEALSALPAAARLYGYAIALWPEDDPERPGLLLRHGRALLLSDVGGEELLLAAAEELAAVGDLRRAAEAEGLLVALYQEEGRGELVQTHFSRAGELASQLPPSLEKAEVLAEITRSRMMAGEHEEAIRAGDEALALCDELGLDEVRATVLHCVGPSHLDAADPEAALAAFEQGIAVAERIDSHELAHGYGNLAEVLSALGDFPGAFQARRTGLEHAERLGLRWYARWLRIQELQELYYALGEWDELLARAEKYVQERTILATPAYEFTMRVRAARGDTDGALADSMRMLELSRASGDLQALGPALAAAAFGAFAAGERDESTRLVDELTSILNWRSLWTYFWIAPLAVVLHELGRGDKLVQAGNEMTVRTPWLDAGVAAASGDFKGAAAAFDRIGAQPDAAYARLRAGEEIERALDYFRSVGAAAYIREAEALLAV